MLTMRIHRRSHAPNCQNQASLCCGVQTHTLLAVPSFFILGCANSSFMPVFALVTARL